MTETRVKPNAGDTEAVVGLRGHRVRNPERAREQRENILRVAAEVFGENGYVATTMEQVAERLGVTKPAIYYHFRGKEELYVQVRIAGAQDGARRLDQMITTHREPIAILRAVARDLVTGTFDPANQAMTLIDYQGPLSGQAVARIREAQRNYRAMLRKVIERGIADGTLADGDARVMALVFIDALHSILHWYRADGRLSRDAVADEVVERAMGVVLPTREGGSGAS